MQIVIVDSSRVVLRIIASLLEPHGHAVHVFTDSQAALAYLTATPSVRVLITSLDTRPLSGLDLCGSARLLADERRPLHVITMSSDRTIRNLAGALDGGADDFIDKPPGAEELNARLRVAERLTTMQEALIRLADTDPLTGLYNRRAFFARAGAAAEQARRHGRLSVVLADIDRFKGVNDTYGHDVGDLAIRAVADLVGAEGIAGRLGGEEFAVLLPGRDLAQAADHAEVLRSRARALRIPSDRGPVGLSCSFGVGSWIVPDSVAALIKRADLALYGAKTGGRDRVVTQSPAPCLARAGRAACDDRRRHTRPATVDRPVSAWHTTNGSWHADPRFAYRKP